MKTKRFFSALALMAVTMFFASCSSDDEVSNVPSQKEIETKIIGKWKSTMDMGMHKGEVLTNGRVIYSYNADHTGFASHSARTPEGYSWDNKSPFSFSLKGNVLSEKPEEEHIMERSFKIIAIDDNSMTNELSMPAMPDEEKMPALVMTFTKVTADYSNDIIGMWEGVEMTGYETYGNAEARIEYRADGTYTYYVKDGDYWVPSANVGNEYNVDGDWLATRWRPEAGADYNYEWWDIDEIKDGTMKWSALREKEDGTRFTTTFTWRKVELPSQQEIETKIVGKWKNVDEVVPTNKRIILSFLNKPQSFVSYCLYVVPLNSTMWCNRMSTEYAITNQNLNIKGDYSLFGKSVSMEFDLFVNRFDNEFMYATLLKQSAPSIGVEYNQPVDMTWKKVTADYSQDVLGLWEGVDMTGDETYGNAEARIEYRADGTYIYYKRVDGEWQPLADVIDEYNVDGDWLATRWQNNGSDVMNYEWWDIDYIKKEGNGIIMKWSALREKEDGTRFTTTFTWKKVK